MGVGFLDPRLDEKSGQMGIFCLDLRRCRTMVDAKSPYNPGGLFESPLFMLELHYSDANLPDLS